MESQRDIRHDHTEILTILQRDIHPTVFATADEQRQTQTCVIDLMLADENGLYFLTAHLCGEMHRLSGVPERMPHGMYRPKRSLHCGNSMSICPVGVVERR